MVIAGPGGERTVAAADFFDDLFTTALAEDEILVEVRVPKHTGWGGHYEKFNRVAQAWSIVAVAAAVRPTAARSPRRGSGSTNMGSTADARDRVEQALVGRPATAEAVGRPSRPAAEGTNPPSDTNGDADYRRHLAGVLTGRAVLAAAGG